MAIVLFMALVNFVVDSVEVIACVALLAAGAYTWFFVPIFGRYVTLVCVAAAVGLFAYTQGQDAGRAECKAAAVQAELDTAYEDLRIARVQADDAHARSVALDALAQKSTETIDGLQHELDAATAAVPTPVAGACPAPRPDSTARLDRDSVGKLLGRK